MQIVIALFDRFTALDAVGPHQVLHHLPGAEVIFAAERTRVVTDESRTLSLRADASYAEVPHPPFDSGSPATAKPEIVERFTARSRFAVRG